MLSYTIEVTDKNHCDVNLQSRADVTVSLQRAKICFTPLYELTL